MFFTNKESVYEIYCKIIPDTKAYDRISREKMIQECINYYNDNPDSICHMLSEPELSFLEKFINKSSPSNEFIERQLFELFLIDYNEKTKSMRISAELKDAVNKALDFYYANKKRIEQEKKNAYLFVGLFRVYGLLTYEMIDDYLHNFGCTRVLFTFMANPYCRRFISYYEKAAGLFGLYLSKDLDRLDYIYISSPRKKYSKETIIDIGKNYFDTKTDIYQKIFNNECFAQTVIKRLNYERLIILTGSGDYSLSEIIPDYISNSLDKSPKFERNMVEEFIASMPRFIPEINESVTNEVIPNTDAQYFLQVFFPLFDFVNKHYNLNVSKVNNEYTFGDKASLINVIVSLKFSFLDAYFFENPQLSEEDINTLIAIKQHYVNGPFYCVKHTRKGSLFLKDKTVYLVKGLTSKISEYEIFKKLPKYCDTFIFPFRGNIIYSSILLTKEEEETLEEKDSILLEYEKYKDNVVTKL